MAQRASSGVIIEGKYRLERELGAGGMGAVWLATQLMVDRKVAVKLLHPAFIDQDDLQARFEVEAKAIGRLNHPNCITLFDFGHSDELEAFYTVIEYVEGQPLDKRLGERVPIPEIVTICRQIALALDHAHHQGILHRDLKPENVMLARMTDGSEMVKVLDFGIARIVSGDAQESNDDSQRITKAGEVFGTPAYMSPEQARSIRQLTPAADLYSLGVILYELAAGELPFFAQSAFDLLMLHVTKPVPPIEDPRIPEDFKELVYRLMAKDPAQRLQSGKAVAAALDALGVASPAGGSARESGGWPTRVDSPSRPMPSPSSSADLYARNASGEFVRINDPSGEYFASNGGRGEYSQQTMVGAPGADEAYPVTASVEVEIPRRRRHALIALVIVILLGVGGLVAVLTTGPTEGASTAEGVSGAEDALSPGAPSVAATTAELPGLDSAAGESGALQANQGGEESEGTRRDTAAEDLPTARRDEAAVAEAATPSAPVAAPGPAARPSNDSGQRAPEAAPKPTRRKRPSRSKPSASRDEAPVQVPKFNLDQGDESDSEPAIPKLDL